MLSLLLSAVHSCQPAFAYVDVLVSHWELDQRSALMGTKFVCFVVAYFQLFQERECIDDDGKEDVLAGAYIYFQIK